jgi:hypothetical protein
MRGLCEFLEIDWEPELLEYGSSDHGPIRMGLGDASENIRSGRIQPARALPARSLASPELVSMAACWGYETVDRLREG